MKRLTVLMALLMPVFLLSSCGDDNGKEPENNTDTSSFIPGYVPAKKIAHKYIQRDGGEKKLNTTYYWSGNRLDSLRTYNEDGSVKFRQIYEYSNSKVSRITEYYGNSVDYVQFYYDGDQLVRTEAPDGDRVYVNKYIYTGNRITEAQIWNTSSKPEITYTYEYEGDNTIKVMRIDGSEGYTQVITFDKGYNPYYGLIILDKEFGIDDKYHSKNNWLTVEQTPEDPAVGGDTRTYEYTYTYDKDNWVISEGEGTSYAIYYEYK